MRILSVVAIAMSLLDFQGCRKDEIGQTYNQIEKPDSILSSVNFTNTLPSNDGSSYQDPWVIYLNGNYYYCGSDGGRLWITKSATLQDILMQRKTYIFTPPYGTMYSQNLWAPELHYLNGRWYVYFAADDGNNKNHRMHVLSGGINASDPLNGGFEYKTRLRAATDNWAIDGSPFTYAGQLYFVWSGWPGNTNITQHLYIAKMSNPYTITGERVDISAPENGWETHGSPTVNEGPEVLISGSTINVIYSASGSWTNDYCLGRLTCTNGNPMDKNSWTKTGPVFKKFGNVYGPGHASFVKSPDGIQWWIIYHAANYSGSGWDRRVMAQQFSWEGEVPYFGFPIQKGIRIPEPSISENYSMPVPNGTYKIKSKATGLYLNVPKTFSLPGTQIDLNRFNESNSEEWIFINQGNGYYKIRSACSNLCLDDAGGAFNANNPMIQWNDNGETPQRWRVQNMGNGYFKIINMRSLLALKISDENVGSRLEQSYETNDDSELWQIIPY